MLGGILMIVIGALAAASIVTKVVKNSEKIIAVLVPIQGWLGIAALVWGIFGVIGSITTIGWMAFWPIGWITGLAVAVVEVLIGFLLGYGLIAKLAFSKNEEAKKKGDEMLAKLAPVQGTIGIIGIALGIWMILTTILFPFAII